ncbi:MAG: ABC transporter substrate-binding protein [Treponema sp.]|nr:ABC transporter substrate-binding protein [Treponema sp.]
MKMKHLALAGVVALLVFTGCPRPAENRLVIWSFTDEIENMIEMHNIGEALGMEIDYSLTPTDQFTDRLTPALMAGRGVAPDVFALEAAFVRMYIESGLLLDLTDLYHEVRGRVLSYPVAVATHNGRVYGMSWQATPGAMFFRRSLALRYLGTDDPALVQQYFANWDRFVETARYMSAESAGRTVVISSLGDLNHPFRGGRTQPWVVNGRLHIDPAMIRWMEMSRYLTDNALEGRVGQWSEGWFAGMQGNLADEIGPLDVFAYFLPTWGLHFVLAQNAPETSGDWAMIPGPAPWFWGGTWLAAYQGTRHPEAARNFIRLLTMDEGNLERWARETGDFLNNMNVVNRIVGDFAMPFLGGQNHYAAFAAMAPYIDGSLIQGTDEAIDAIFMEAITQYANAEATMEQALAMFREQVAAQLGIN